jgi:hypothetical protein
MSATEIEIYDDDDKSISFSDEHSHTTIDFHPETKQFVSRLGLMDDMYYRNETYEYKISTHPVGVMARLLERTDEPPKEYFVRDSVVLESAFANKPMLEDLAKDLRKEVEWHSLDIAHDFATIFFILSLHPEIIPEDEYRKFLRQTEEQIKIGLMKIEKFLKANDTTGLAIFEGEYGRQLWNPDIEGIPYEDLEKKARHREEHVEKPLFDKTSPDYCGISQGEFRGSAEILKQVEYFLNKKPAAASTEKSAPRQLSTAQELTISLILTLAISWVVSWFVNINPFLIFILVQIISFIQAILGRFMARALA